MGCGTSLQLNDGPFDAKAEARLVRQSIKGLGTDEALLVKVLTRRTWEQRVDIALAYKEIYAGRNMADDVHADLGGVGETRFRTLMGALLMEPHVFDAHSLRRAVKGLGTNESTIIELLSTRSNEEIVALREAYEAEFSRDPVSDVHDDTSGDFRKVILTLLEAKRDPEDSIYPAGQIELDAQTLHAASEGRFFTDRKPFIEVFTKRSYSHMVKVWPALDKLGKFTTLASVEHHLGNTVLPNDFKHAMAALVKVSRNPLEFFSERLQDALSKRVKTDWRTVVRIFAYTEDLLNSVEDTYNKRQGGKTLRKMIADNTSGDFRRALISLLDHANLRVGALVHA